MFGGGPMIGAGVPDGGPAGATGTTAASCAPQAWQNELPSGFCVPHRAHVSAIYVALVLLFFLVAGSTCGRRPRLTEVGAALSAMPQLGQKPEATMCM